MARSVLYTGGMSGDTQQRGTGGPNMQQTWHRHTARQIVAAKTGETKGGHNISTVDGHEVRWTYRTHRNADGTRQSWGRHTLTTADRADSVEIEDGKVVALGT